MPELLKRLAEDHHRYTRLMDMLEGLLDQFHAGLEPDYQLLSELMEYLLDFADQVHHPSEELLFERIRARTTEGAEAILQVRRQHQALGGLARPFRDSVMGIMSEAVLPREEVEIQGRALIALQREHLRIEDEQVFPLARQVLTAADWAELQALAPKVDDPVFGHADRERFRSLYRALKAAAGG